MLGCILAANAGVLQVDEHTRPWGNAEPVDDRGKAVGGHPYSVTFFKCHASKRNALHCVAIVRNAATHNFRLVSMRLEDRAYKIADILMPALMEH